MERAGENTFLALRRVYIGAWTIQRKRFMRFDVTHWLRIEKQYLKFSSAHFTLLEEGHEPLHGHNYTVAVELEAETLRQGFVVNFVPLKSVLRARCEALDERVLIPESPRIAASEAGDSLRLVVDRTSVYVIPAGDVVQLPMPNVTCELLAQVLCRELVRRRGEWDPHGQVKRVRLWVEETPGQSGGYETILDETSTKDSFP